MKEKKLMISFLNTFILIHFYLLFQDFCSSIAGFPPCRYLMMGKYYNLRKRDSKIGVNVKIGNGNIKHFPQAVLWKQITL